jgi:hypothetical protein
MSIHVRCQGYQRTVKGADDACKDFGFEAKPVRLDLWNSVHICNIYYQRTKQAALAAFPVAWSFPNNSDPYRTSGHGMVTHVLQKKKKWTRPIRSSRTNGHHKCLILAKLEGPNIYFSSPGNILKKFPKKGS